MARDRPKKKQRLIITPPPRMVNAAVPDVSDIVEEEIVASVSEPETHGTLFGRREADILDLLQRAEITSISLIPWGSNYTFLATLEVDKATVANADAILPYAEASNTLARELYSRFQRENGESTGGFTSEDADVLLGIYKPVRGEAPLWDFPNGTLYQREQAAYVFSTLVGWDFIPPVVVREKR